RARGNRGRRGRRAVRPRSARLQPGIRAAPPLPVRPAPRAAANAGSVQENAECGMRNADNADDKWQMADGKCRMADDTGRMADDRGQMTDDTGRMADDGSEVRSGGCGDGESGEPPPQAPSEEMSQESWELLYGASWPRSQTTGIAGTSGGCGEGERARSEPTPQECRAPQKAPHEAQTRINAKLFAAGC